MSFAAAPITVCLPFAGGLVGGSHVSCLKLVERLDRARFRPLVVLHRGGGPLEALLAREGIAFIAAPTADHLVPGRGWRRQLAGWPGLVARLAGFLRRHRVDIVHSNDGAMHATWGPAARLAGARLLWHHRGNPDAAGLRLLAPLLADRVVAVSRYAAPRPGRWSAAARCDVVHSPFDTDIADPRRDPARLAALRASLPVPQDAALIGFFGHLTARKRPLVFVEAIAALAHRLPERPVHGLMFGEVLDPGLDVVVRRHAERLGVGDRIHAMGFRVPVDPWLALCDIKLVTAVEEPFGRTLIEAMLLGTPVVAAASGGNLEAIDDRRTGLLVPPDDAGRAAAAVAMLLRQPAYAASLAAAARAEATTRYGIDRHVAALSAIYRELAQR